MSLSRLLIYKLKLFLANLSRGGGRKRYFRIVSVAVLLAALVAFAFGAYAIFKALHSFGQDGLVVAGLVVAMAFHALLIVALVFDIAATANIFFLSSDLNLLMAAPLRPIKVFGLKYLEALGSGSVIPLLAGVPILLGYGLAFGAPYQFYVVIVPLILVFLSVPVSIGTLSGIIISRFVPASRVKEVLGVVGGVLAMGFWFAIQILRPRLAEPDSFTDLGSSVRAVASYADHAVLRLLPSRLASRCATLMVTDGIRDAIAPLLALAAGAGCLIVISMLVAERMYLTGWTRVIPAGSRRKAGPRRALVRRVYGWLPPVERGILSTTTSLLTRDPQQIMPVAAITIMMAVLPFLLGESRTRLVLSHKLLLQSFTALTFIGSLHLAANATVIDGRGFWIVLAAPCSAMRKLTSKLLVPTLFFVPLASGIAFALAAMRIVEWSFLFEAVWLASCTSCIGGSAGILLGVSYADWEWEIPKRMLRTSGRLLMLGIMAIFFMGVAILVSAAVPVESASMSRAAGWIVLPAGSVVAVVVSTCLLRISAKKLDRMEWTL